MTEWSKAVVPGSPEARELVRLRLASPEPEPEQGYTGDAVAASWLRIVRQREKEPWPDPLLPAALHGLAGRVVGALLPHTESDPAALLLNFLVSFGSAVGPGPHGYADGSEHPARLNGLLVGDTSRARKGTSWANIRRVMVGADPGWAEERIVGGLASGEGLIAKLHDGSTEDGEPVESDRRLLVVEPEFARLLGVASREGSTVSAIVRDAWDSGQLRVMTRKDPLVATGTHVSVLGHITRDELLRTLAGVEIANGFANRFLFVLVRRSSIKPNGGRLDEIIRDLGAEVHRALSEARKVGRLRRSDDAEQEWTRLYCEIAENDAAGLVGSITARAEAQLLRLSVVYALLDGCRSIEVEHLHAASAVWRYSEASARIIFGNSLGDEIADRLLAAVRQAGKSGLDREQQRALFSRHVSSDRLAQARSKLEERGLAKTESETTAGRPRQVLRATS